MATLATTFTTDQITLETTFSTSGARLLQGPTGDAGQDGTNGLSAYEVAVENGFIGDEEEWLASLAPQVTRSFVELGSSDCAVTITPPYQQPNYSLVQAAANTALLNSLFNNYAKNGGKNGVVQLPAGALHTIGPTVIPYTASLILRGAGARGAHFSDVANACQGTSRWLMQRVPGTTDFSPGLAAQVMGLDIEDIVFTNRHRVLANDAWIETETGGSAIPTCHIYAAPNLVAESDPDYLVGLTEAYLGTGKWTLKRCQFQNSIGCPGVQTCHPNRPTSNNADTITFDHCEYFGSGPAIGSYSEQNVRIVFNELYFEGFDRPNLIDLYKIGGVTITGGTLAHPCVLVKLNSEIVSAEPIIRIHDLQLDNNCRGVLANNTNTIVVDGWGATSNLTAVSIIGDCINFPYQDSSANGPFFRLSANQRLDLSRSHGLQAGLIGFQSIYRAGTNYGQTNYTFRPDVYLERNHIAKYLESGNTLADLKHSVSRHWNGSAWVSPVAAYEFGTHRNLDALMRKFQDEDLGVVP